MDASVNTDSLLLYLEIRAVDYGGKVVISFMSKEEVEVAKRWNKEEYISFGRICSEDLSDGSSSYWVQLSEEAWDMVHILRKQRANKAWKERRFRTTEEYRKEEQS